MFRVRGHHGGTVRSALSLAFAGILASSGAAEAQTAEPQTFQACRVPDVGAIYMVGEPGTPEQCLSPDHVAFSWTEQGETGPEGPAGPEGPPGPQGPEGPQGPAWSFERVERVVSPLTRVEGGAPSIVSVPCPVGTVVASVGFTRSLGVEVAQSILDVGVNAAVVTFRAVTPDGGSGTAYAYCLPLDPGQE